MEEITASQDHAVETFQELKGTRATDVVRAMQNKRAMEIAEGDEDVRRKIDESAKRVIDNSTQVVRNESEADVTHSHFILHKTAIQMYGFNEERPLWQQKMMQIGSAVWFVVYFIIASITVCPLSVFFDVFKNIFKRGWLAMIVTIIAYLCVVVGIPLLTSFGGKFYK